MNKKHSIAIMVFIIIATIITMPTIMKTIGASTAWFNVSLTVNGGNPIITHTYAISDSPNEGTTKIVHFYFNATHPNGVISIPAANAHVTINLSTVYLTDSGCVISSTNGADMNMYDCNITLYYYTLPGTYTINATVTDSTNNYATNTTAIYTNGNIYGITLNTNNVAFAGAPGAVDIEANHTVNNTGNNAFTQMNITAYSLVSGSNIIGAGNFTANTSNSGGAGQMLINNTAVALIDASLAVNSTRSIYLYADIPAGIANGTYTSSDAWILTVN